MFPETDTIDVEEWDTAFPPLTTTQIADALTRQYLRELAREWKESVRVGSTQDEARANAAAMGRELPY